MHLRWSIYWAVCITKIFLFLNNLSLFFIFNNVMKTICESITTYRLLLNYCFKWQLFITYSLCHLLTTCLTSRWIPKFINGSQHSCVKTYSEDIFREACLCKHMQLSLILPTLLWPEMRFCIFVCSTQTWLVKNACQALNVVRTIH